MRLIIFLFVLCALSACRQKSANETHTTSHCAKQASLPVHHARGFTIDYYEGFKVVQVRSISDSTKILAQYVVLPAGKKAPVDFKDAVLIDTPITSVVCVSTNHMAALARLDLLDVLKGVTNQDLIYNKEIKEAIKNGTISNLGNSELNYEKLVTLKPDFVFTSGDWDGGDKMNMKLTSLKMKSVLNRDYMEQDPLARAEWLKFTSAFFDKETEADSIFREIETRYLALKNSVKESSKKPTVFCNLPFKEIWYMPSGENFMARLISDAGGEFLWKDAKSTNGLNLSLDYEAVYQKAAAADIWINTGTAGSIADLKSADRKNAFFKAVKNKTVYNNDLRNTPSGGFDFWESGVVAPDVVLADLISIFYPDSIKDHRLYYYRKLN